MSPSLPLPADEDLPEEIRAALANLPPLNVFRAVASVPASFRPFLELGGSLLAGPEIDAHNREIAILAVARETGATYERAQHEQLAATAGVSAAEIEAIREGDPSALDADGALAYRAATEISRDVRISDEALAALVERWGDARRRGADPLRRLLQHGQPLPRVGGRRDRGRAAPRRAVARGHPRAR